MISTGYKRQIASKGQVWFQRGNDTGNVLDCDGIYRAVCIVKLAEL